MGREGDCPPVGALSTRASTQPERSAERKTGETSPRRCWGGRCSVSLPSPPDDGEIGAGIEAGAPHRT